MSFVEKYEMCRVGYKFTAKELNKRTEEKLDMCKDTKNIIGNTLLFWMIKHKSDEVPEFIEKWKHILDFDIQNNIGWTALMTAAIYSNTNSNHQIVKVLIKIGADVNKQEKDSRWTALMMAARNSNTESKQETVEALIKAGSNVNIQDSYGWTALMHSARYSDTESKQETVDTLIKAGVNVNIQTNDGFTALMLAAAFSNEDSKQETVEALIKAGSNVNIQQEYGWTALMIAVRLSRTKSKQETVEALIKAGSDISEIIDDNVSISIGRLKEFLEYEKTIEDMVKYAPGNEGAKEVENNFYQKVCVGVKMDPK